MALTRDFYIPKGSTKIEDSNTDAVAYINDYGDGTKYTAMVFAGKRSKYDKYYGFRTAEQRDNYVQEYFKKIAFQYESKKAWAKKQKAEAENNQKNYKVGDILVSCWGYDQTNVDYYQIVDRTKCMAILQPIGSEYVDTHCSGSYHSSMPKKDYFIGAPMKKKVGPYGVSISSFQNASLWDGHAKYETDSQCGH
jgi:hypothetical protein|tara:strand:+ start:44 stop:625 length:582 start_codon:yes stop_codon:yes gene_type:complete